MRKKVFALLGVTSLLASILFFRPRFIMRWVERSTHTEAVFSVETGQNVLALTIDDGPHPELTPHILDILAAYRVKATFFLIGERARAHPDLVWRIIDEGHEIGNHLMADQPSIQLSDAEFEQQLLETDTILQPFGAVQWVRPGSGWYNRQMLDTTKRHDYRLVVGSVYPYDAQTSNVPFITNYVLANAFPGAIILLHDGTDDRWHTTEVLEKVLPELLNRGYDFLTMSELAALEE